ncbi:hypothetical protein EJB05_53620, partial [Eragrostis curvula]
MLQGNKSYGFHSERKRNPDKFKNQMTNQGTYAEVALKKGWFCASLSHPTSRNLSLFRSCLLCLTAFVPLRSIVCLNLPSFPGGLNALGTPGTSRAADVSFQGEFTPPYVDDGLIEVVGFRDAWHGLVYCWRLTDMALALHRYELTLLLLPPLCHLTSKLKLKMEQDYH